MRKEKSGVFRMVIDNPTSCSYTNITNFNISQSTKTKTSLSRYQMMNGEM